MHDAQNDDDFKDGEQKRTWRIEGFRFRLQIAAQRQSAYVLSRADVAVRLVELVVEI